MIVYHGTPFGGDKQGVTRFLSNRHALIPFPRQEDLATALDVCQTVVVDNGAFSAWQKGEPVEDWSGYYEWCLSLYRHPAFAWAIIPDVIDGDEQQNDELLAEWPDGLDGYGVPVWHLHESIDRLERLCRNYQRVCLGSSGKYSTPGTPAWWSKIREAMDAICDEHGRPIARLHGLRMAAAEYVCRIPFASVDSTNVAQNSSLIPRFGMYPAPSRWQRAEVIAARMEAFETTPAWNRKLWERNEGDLFAACQEDAT